VDTSQDHLDGQPQDGQDDRQSHEPLQGGREASAHHLRDAQSLATQALSGRRGRRRGQAEAVGDGGELVALLFKAGQQLVEPGHGLSAVATAVVHQDDRTPARRRRTRGDDLGSAWFAPVLGIEVGQHREVSVGRRVAHGRIVEIGQGVGLGGVRRPKQLHGPAGGARDRVLSQGQLQPPPPRRQRGQLGVGERVGTQLVAIRDDPAREIGVRVHLRADDEERDVGMVAGEDVEDLWRPSWIRSVVEGERNRLRRHPAAGRLTGRVDGDHRLRADHIRGRRYAARRRGRPVTLRADVADITVEAHFAEEDEESQDQQQPVGSGLTADPAMGRGLAARRLQRATGRRREIVRVYAVRRHSAALRRVGWMARATPRRPRTGRSGRS
jgi:hypothetical protein